MKMLNFISPNSDLDLDENLFSKWLKGSRANWNSSVTIMTTSFLFLQVIMLLLKELHMVKCLVKYGREVKRPADAFAMYSHLEMTGYQAYTFISIPIIQEKIA